MLQVLQEVRDGTLRVAQIAPPTVQPGQLLIQNACSAISAGTEKMVMDLAGKSLLGKARQRPDQVIRVLQKIREQGLIQTVQQVTQRLSEPIGLGYSSAGTVLACGAGVRNFRPGDHVASNGPHACVVSVPKHLCAKIPEGVAFEQAAFTVISSIALQGVRLARLGLGDTVLVIGLGLVGQITVQLLRAHGCRVLGIDLDDDKCRLAEAAGAELATPGLTAGQVEQLTAGIGADAVLVTAATKSDAPIQLAAEAVRSKGRVVVVGAVGLNLPRQPFYLKEAELVVSCSYGPGRYDPQYEQGGQDYPVGHVRWTEARNLQAILDLMGRGALDLQRLITHRFAVEDAQTAYGIIKSGSQPYLGMVLDYEQANSQPAEATIQLRVSRPTTSVQIGCLGAGAFAKGVLLPALKRVPGFQLRTLCSARGLSASTSGRALGFQCVTADENAVIDDPAIDAVMIITRHSEHARLVIRCLKSGKHVFTEKPLALTLEEVAAIEAALQRSGEAAPLLMVGFNRRFAPATEATRNFFAEVRAPLTISFRFNSGPLPPNHWTQDEKIGGGRIIGEACHAIDLVTHLAQSPPVRVFAESIGGPNAPAISDDQSFITLRHANGSISSVAYLAGGDRALPKERIEVIGGGRFAVIDDFRQVTLGEGGNTKVHKWTQDKGHQAGINAFAKALGEGGPGPIAWSDLKAVALASILAVQSMREAVPLDLPGIHAGQRRAAA